MTDELDPKLQEFEAKLRKIMLPGYLVEQLQIKRTHSHRYTNQKFSKEITKMNANITRRAALTTVFAILAGGPFAIRYFRKQGNTGIVDYEERKVDSLFTSIIRPEMSSVEALEEDFDAVISLAPLRDSARRLQFVTNTQGGMQYVDQGVLDEHRKLKMPSQITRHETHYNRSEVAKSYPREDLVYYKQRVSVDNTQLSEKERNLLCAQYVVTFDGIVLEPKSDDPLLTGLTPRYPVVPVSVGDTWTQTLRVDPKLNSGGTVDTRFDVLNTYVKSGERFVRIASDLSYKTFLPVIKEDPRRSPVDVDGRVMSLRQVTVGDFNIDTGIEVFSRSILLNYAEKCPFADNEDMLMTTYAETSLVGDS